MAAPAKIVQSFAMLAKEETTYGTPVAVTGAADAIQAQFENRDIPWPAPAFSFDGDLGPAVGSLGTIKRAAQSGRSMGYEFPTRAKGAGAAYSATVVPSIHRLLKASGFDAAVDLTASAEKWTYDPHDLGATAFVSLTAELYGRSKGATAGEKIPLTGVIADWAFDFATPGPPMHRFTLAGYLSADIADSDLPAGLAYPLTTIDAPLATAVTFVLGSLSANAEVASGSFSLAREIQNPRVRLTASGGHKGFIPRGRAPELKIVLERTALVGSPYTGASAFDPYKLQETAQNFVCSVQFGSVQYNRWKLTLPTAQVIGVADQIVNGVGCVELTIRPYVSSPTARDDVQVLFN